VTRARRRSQRRRIELILILMAIAGAAIVVLTSQYTISLRSPLLVRLQFPLVFAPRREPEIAGEVRADQAGRRLTAYQQYACNKFGPACRVALAV
jgi:hypothetical protein